MYSETQLDMFAFIDENMFGIMNSRVALSVLNSLAFNIYPLQTYVHAPTQHTPRADHKCAELYATPDAAQYIWLADHTVTVSQKLPYVSLYTLRSLQLDESESHLRRQCYPNNPIADARSRTFRTS